MALLDGRERAQGSGAYVKAIREDWKAEDRAGPRVRNRATTNSSDTQCVGHDSQGRPYTKREHEELTLNWRRRRYAVEAVIGDPETKASLATMARRAQTAFEESKVILTFDEVAAAFPELALRIAQSEDDIAAALPPIMTEEEAQAARREWAATQANLCARGLSATGQQEVIAALAWAEDILLSLGFIPSVADAARQFPDFRRCLELLEPQGPSEPAVS